MVEGRTSATAIGAAAAAAPAPRRERSFWHRPRPIGLYLALLALVTLAPAFLYSALVLQRNNEAQREVVQTLVYGTAGSLAQSVDRELSSMLTTLRILATLPSLQQGDYETFHSRAQAALEGTGTFMILLDDRLRQILNTRVAFGTDLGPTSDPASARLAVERDAPVVSDAFLGKTSGKWVFNVVLPVVEGDGSKRVLILTRNAEKLSDTLRSQQFPPGWKVVLLDTQGAVIASSDPETETGRRFFLQTGANGAQGLVRETEGGVDYLAVVQPSLNSDWRVVAWAPKAVLREPFRRAFELLVVGGLLIAAAALLAVVWLSRRIGRPVGRLARDAERLGRGEDVEPFDPPISEVATVSAALSEASRSRKAAENEIRFLMREVAHRSKNQLAVIAAIAKQTAKGADSLRDFEVAFQRRLQGLARSTDLMVKENASGVELLALVETQLEPFRPTEQSRVSLRGPHCRLSIHSAQMLGMAIHELATNAAKYGAFAGTAGSLDVSWHDTGQRLSLQWRERTVQAVAESGRSGFGTMVIERMVGQSLGAEVERRLHGDGIEWRFEIPRENLDGGGQDAGEAHPELHA
ncbi:Two-component sensor histidine kinase, contains HisKA and HATPase domains [Tistlia consotensis]|uniref:histidine kinase n=1 Tax=Tistlia consotensis USBA 355 TaxID=560819 RepID=A0A1Y6C3U3_9PROT|nr:sensor histidine kinase [Tistlia consotensis]SMF44113.1 Two-component sensor histidine kinase, contains HisKA and HATPase domains [Tistlia consotensis USBA 355]SNR43080.1 Two-component sensor histidine kinase, contains HisKA and HATPase domains [Tistlia consotensis]